MRPGWNSSSPALLPTIVCYADILGFRAMTERAYELGKETEFLQACLDDLVDPTTDLF